VTTKCEQSPYGWTLDTLEEFLSNKIEGIRGYFSDLRLLDKESVTTAMIAAEKAIAAAMTASEKAILKAEMAAEKRSEASNEIRAAMIDQQKNFADKVQTEFRFGAMDQRLEENYKSLTKRLDGVDNAITLAGGKSQGIGVSYGVFIGLATLLVAIVVAIELILRHA
jgi:hypothetical protein